MQDSADNIIPEQQTGNESNTEYSAIADSLDDAKKLFKLARQRLEHVNNWNKLAKGITADFQLTDHHGNKVERSVHKDDFFKIDIPGPGPSSGDGYDWVQIESIEEETNPNAEEEYFAIRVRPASSPLKNDNDTAHFFKNAATSTFKVHRKKNKVTAGVYGRNEIPNTDAGKPLDKARNVMTALSAVAIFSKLQWKNLVKGLIKG